MLTRVVNLCCFCVNLCVNLPNTSTYKVKNLPTSDDGAAVLDHEVNQMLQKGAIKVVQSNDNENVWFLQDQ